MSARNARRMHNEELLELLFSEEDRLSRQYADEIIRRGPEMLPILADIVMDRIIWTAEFPDWWAPVHATYMLGAIGGPDALIPLLSALRWSDAYDNEWVTEDLPSILGSMGDLSWDSLLGIIKDKSAGWSARSIAMDALGSQALRNPKCEEEAMAAIASVLRDAKDEQGARRSAAFVLLDFRRSDCRSDLVSLAKKEMRAQQQQPDYRIAFTPDDVEKDLASPRLRMDIYTRDWLAFYNPEEIRQRQERWRKEDGRMREEAFQPVTQAGRHAVVIKRGDPCPCGSGKPYKRCCLRKLH